MEIKYNILQSQTIIGICNILQTLHKNFNTNTEHYPKLLHTQ